LPAWIIALLVASYLGLLFVIAYYGDKRADAGRSLIANPYVYALSLGVYTTAWTFYGSVGRAAASGIGFLPVYIGTTVMVALWWTVLRKIIRIAKQNRITSLADFISSRYGKSAALAGLVTVIFHRFKQPVVLGYILAGVIIGPYTPPFPLIQDKATIHTLAELGVILLMFSLGLEFNLRKLTRVGGTAFVAALLEILLMVWVGYEIGRLFGWTTMDSLFLGGLISMSSTTIIARALDELGLKTQTFASVVVGVLVIEDIVAVLLLVLNAVGIG